MVASINLYGAWSGAGPAGSGSHPAEVLHSGREGFGGESYLVSFSHPVEVLGCGGEGSGTEMSVSAAHPVEVLGAGLTIFVLSELI